MSGEPPSGGGFWAERFPELHRLFAGYFNQDWMEEGLNAEETLRFYLIDAPPEALGVAREELEALLALGLDEAELARVLHPGLGCFRIPSLAGGSNTAWLEEISAELARTLDEGIPAERIPLEREGPDPGELVGASSFPDRATAQEAVQEAIDHNEDGIAAWLEAEAEAGLRYAISHDTGHVVGQMLARMAPDDDGETVEVTGVRVVLERSTASRNGFRLLAYFPDVV